MKTLVLGTTLLACAGLVQAQDIGKVISRAPVYQAVSVPKQVCTPVPATPSSGAGAVVGAIAGGLLGQAMGGNGPATAAGAIGGAILGGQAETSRNAASTACRTETSTENRLVGYLVTYEFAGKQYTAQLPQDPGETIALQIAPAGMAPVAPPPVVQALSLIHI